MLIVGDSDPDRIAAGTRLTWQVPARPREKVAEDFSLCAGGLAEVRRGIVVPSWQGRLAWVTRGGESRLASGYQQNFEASPGTPTLGAHEVERQWAVPEGAVATVKVLAPSFHNGFAHAIKWTMPIDADGMPVGNEVSLGVMGRPGIWAGNRGIQAGARDFNAQGYWTPGQGLRLSDHHLRHTLARMGIEGFWTAKERTAMWEALKQGPPQLARPGAGTTERLADAMGIEFGRELALYVPSQPLGLPDAAVPLNDSIPEDDRWMPFDEMIGRYRLPTPHRALNMGIDARVSEKQALRLSSQLSLGNVGGTAWKSKLPPRLARVTEPGQTSVTTARQDPA